MLDRIPVLTQGLDLDPGVLFSPCSALWGFIDFFFFLHLFMANLEEGSEAWRTEQLLQGGGGGTQGMWNRQRIGHDLHLGSLGLLLNRLEA